MDYREYTRQFIELTAKIQASRSLDDLNRHSKGETRLLANLFFNGGGMQAKDLAKLAGVSTARVTALMKLVEKKGYIKKEPIEGDRRKVKVILTGEGEEECRRRYQYMQDQVTEYFAYLGEEDSEHFLQIIRRSMEYLETKRKEEQSK
jgi:DNA-binding MarR family transcriptional regulator